MGVDTESIRSFAAIPDASSVRSTMHAAADELDVLRAEIERKDSLVRSLLNKVSKVTAYYRHGRTIPEQCLVDLSNGQIDFQDAYYVPRISPYKP